MNVAGVLLAGGLARRMGGGDKCLQILAGRTLLDHVVERIAPQTGPLVLNANGDAARFAAWGLPVLPDSIPGHAGPLAGVLAGLRWAAANGAADIITAPADTPFLPRDLVARLRDARESADLAVAASGGRLHPIVALWRTNMAEDLERALRDEDMRRVTEFQSRYRLARVDFPIAAVDPFFNVNTREDLAAATRFART